MADKYRLISQYRGNKLYCSDPSLGYTVQEPLIKFADGTLLSLETGKIFHEGPQFQNRTIKLIMATVTKSQNVVSMTAHNIKGSLIGKELKNEN